MQYRMNITKPAIFWNAFSAYLTERLAKMRSWQAQYEDGTTWTKTLTTIINDFGKECGYSGKGEVSNEYFRIDALFSKMAHKQDPFAWDLDVAIEIENNAKQWYDEVVKLSHINCGLKVIIAYHNFGDADALLQAKLKRVQKLIKNRKYKNATTDWLIIFGPHSCDERHVFRAFSIRDTSITALSPKKVFPAKP